MRRSGRLGTAVGGAIVLVLLVGLVLVIRNRSVLYGNDYFLFGLFGLTALAYVAAGVAILRRAPAHAIGWLCLGVAGALEGGLALTQVGILAIRVSPGSLPAPGFALIVAQTTPFLTLAGIVLILLLFPSGRPLSRPWWIGVAAVVTGALCATIATLFVPHRIVDVWSDELSHAGAATANPRGVAAVGGWKDVLNGAAAILMVAGTVGAIVSLVLRRRRGSPDERRQLRWLALIAGAAVTWIAVMVPVMLLTDPNGPAGAAFWLVATPLVALGPPAAIGIGIVRYRLFDIDVVIRKTVVVTLVGVTLTVLYLGVLTLATVGTISRLLVGVALLVITFRPVRRAARSIADRVAYGRRASSYEVLSSFSSRIGETYASDDVVPRMAAILAGATGARSATVWLRVGRELRPAATSGDGAVPRPVPLAGDELPDLGGGAAEVRDRGELLGALSVTMPPNDPLDDGRRRLVADLASQAGLVLRNVRLIEELRESRQRLVAAQDEERRKLERNLHDGAQQQLVALAVQLQLARGLVGKDPDAERATLERLQAQTTDALEELRDLARGIYPPLLADRGLAAALEGQARKAAVPVTVEALDTGRYAREVEATVYFCALEALNNVAKYAEATAVTVRLERRDGTLAFRVSDDGKGFDPEATGHGTGLQGIADRLDAVRGTLTIRSAPGEGTVVEGAIPVSGERS